MSAISIGTFRTAASGEDLSAEDVMYNLNLIKTSYNAAFDATTGHTHDTVDSPTVSSGITNWSFDEAFLLMLSCKGVM